MKYVFFIVLVFFTSLTGILYAVTGDTVEQAKARYGSPSGKLDSGNRTIHIYNTELGKITETYNEEGVCIESNAGEILAKAVTLAPKTSPKKTRSIKPRVTQTQHIPVQEKLPSVALQSQPAPPKTAVATNKDSEFASSLKTIPKLAFVLLFVLSLVGFMFAWAKRKAQILDCRSNTPEEIEAFCKFFQRKEKRKAMEPAQQDPDKPYYKDYPPAA